MKTYSNVNEIPEETNFVATWAYNEMVFGETYQIKNGEVYVWNNTKKGG